MDLGVDALLQAAQEGGGLNEGQACDGDGEDRSSSLSEIEDNNMDDEDEEDEEEGEGSEDLSNPSEDENDSEAETERLEDSPTKFRQQQDLVISNRSYEHSPSKLNKQIALEDMEEEEEDDDLLSSDDISLNETPDSLKSSERGEPEPEDTAASRSLAESSDDVVKALLSATDVDTRKRKRSIMAGSSLDEDLGEPLRKRTGSVMTPGDGYVIEDEANPDDEEDLSNPISGNASGDEGEAQQENEVGEPIVAEEQAAEILEAPISPKKRGRKKKKAVEKGVGGHDDPDSAVNGDYEVRNGDDEHVDVEGVDEAEAAMKNEEERE